MPSRRSCNSFTPPRSNNQRKSPGARRTPRGFEESATTVNNSVPSRTKNSKPENPVFESPDGIEIQINRGGNKMQLIRDLCRNKKITHVQFRMLVPLADMSNEGTHENPELWGKSWLNVETLAKESGCSERAIQDNMPLLEAAGIVKVKRDLTDDGRPKGGRSNFNEYWLPGWNKFGAVSKDQEKGAQDAPFSQSEKGARGSEKGAASSRKGARGSGKGAHGAPDSTHLPNPEPNLSIQPAAPRREGPAGGLNVGGDAQRQKGANDNVKQDDADQGAKVAPWPVDMYQRFMDIYPKGGSPMKVKKELARIEREGRTDYRDILRGATNYKREKAGVEPRYISEPENFLRDGLQEGYQKDHRPKPKCNVAI